MEREQHDNREKQRGDFYQILVGIYYALDEPFKELIIEHKGDITFDNHLQIEVKHHAPRCSLGDKHIDFWKTLFNWCNSKYCFDKLVLHTTAYFPTTDSVLRTWNGLTPDKRVKKITDLIKSDQPNGIKKYMDFIGEMEEDKLKLILAKIEIKTNQDIDTDLIDRLTKHSTIQAISCKPESRPILIKERIAGYINSKVVDKKKWMVTRNQFIKILQDIGKQYLDETYSPTFDIYFDKNLEESKYVEYKEKKFVEELTSISCDENEVKEAINDYWRTNTVIAIECENNPTFHENYFVPYKKEHIHKKLCSTKKLVSMTHPNNSLLFYRKAKNLQFGAFRLIPDYPYFHHGTMQLIVEDNNLKFSWTYE